MDKKTEMTTVGRYTKNMVRNDHELRAEAMDLHDRHPYAVLIAMVFLPYRACDDAGLDKSSFAHAVMTFRGRAGREKTSDPNELFERVFIGLYEHEGENRGNISLFKETGEMAPTATMATMMKIPDKMSTIAWVLSRIEFDHILPHSAGGSNSYWNVQVLCAGCNQLKRATAS